VLLPLPPLLLMFVGCLRISRPSLVLVLTSIRNCKPVGPSARSAGCDRVHR
jgi:hypothetical protein